MITIIHPSRGRGQMAFETYKQWMRNCDTTQHIEYIISLDSDDTENYNYKALFAGERIVSLSNRSVIEAINNAVKITMGDLFVVISDDFDCPAHWDTLLLEAVQGRKDFLLKTRDGIQKTLVTLPIMDRAYYNRFGYIYHPDYKHMACDVELTAVALMTGKLLYSDLLFEHLHYSTGKSPKDAINEKNDLTYEHGDMVLKEHLRDNFGIEKPVMRYEEIVWH